MRKISFGAALAALGIIILATTTPAAAQEVVIGTDGVAPLFGGNASLRSTPAATCAGAKALQNPQTTPEHPMAWWPDLCGACSESPQCVGLLVLDVRPCGTGDGGWGICRSTGNYCTDSNPDDDRDEVSCYCDYAGTKRRL